jgi:30S ribosomal protein S31
MGKGDKRTRKGKIFKGSYGKTRPRHKKKLTGTPRKK